MGFHLRCRYKYPDPQYSYYGVECLFSSDDGHFINGVSNLPIDARSACDMTVSLSDWRVSLCNLRSRPYNEVDELIDFSAFYSPLLLSNVVAL